MHHELGEVDEIAPEKDMRVTLPNELENSGAVFDLDSLGRTVRVGVGEEGNSCAANWQGRRGQGMLLLRAAWISTLPGVGLMDLELA